MLALLRRLLHGETALVAWLLCASLLILGFVGLADEMVEGDMAAFDDTILRALRGGDDLAHPLGPPWFQEMVRDVTALGSFAVLGIMLATVVGYLLLTGRRGAALLMGVAVLGGTLASTLLKHGFDRPRPDIPHVARVFTASFPSGHAMLSAVTFLTIGILLTRVTAERRVKLYVMTIAVVLTIVVGTSRVYLGLHFPSDVLAGWSLGSAWAILCWAVARWVQRRGLVAPPGRAEG